jgi:dUTP pyrophosphatase
LNQHHGPVVPVAGKSSLIPEYATEHAAGADLKADLAENIEIGPGERILIPTGLRMAIPRGYEGQVRPRSGLAIKKGLTVLNSPGTIDSDYRGEVKVILINHDSQPVTVEPGMRIAQLVIAPVAQAVFHGVQELPDSDRGGGGFGSTGI